MTRNLTNVSYRPAVAWPERPACARLRQRGTAAGRAASWILLACDSPDDPSRIEMWSKLVGVSYSQLRSCYSQLGVQPQDARDFTRMLRAIWCAQGRVEHVVSQLVIGDPRTTDLLLEKSGLADRSRLPPITFAEFLVHQQFVESDHPILQALQALFSEL